MSYDSTVLRRATAQLEALRTRRQAEQERLKRQV